MFIYIVSFGGMGSRGYLWWDVSIGDIVRDVSTGDTFFGVATDYR